MSTPFRPTPHRAALFLALLAPTFHAAESAQFPVAVSANHRHLVDRTGTPFFVHGDTAWSLIAAPTTEVAERYLSDRQRHGINAIIVNLIEHKAAPHAPKNSLGDAPFTTAGDFSTPNEAYFHHADEILRLAAAKGILVFLFPCYWGYDGKDEGFWVDLIANSPTACRDYGRFLGQRYKDFTNIVWVSGGDFSPPDDAPGVTRALEILRGIKDRDPTTLHTFHGKRSRNASDHAPFVPYLDLDAVYTGDEIGKGAPDEPYRLTRRAYNRADFKPAFVIESRYEMFTRRAPEETRIVSRPRVRRQPYCATLSGAMGNFFGNEIVWRFRPGWDGPSGLGSPGNADFTHFGEAFASRAWHRLVPDQEHRTVVANYGTLGQLDYVTAARAADGSLVMAYVPPTGTEPRTITIDLTRLNGKILASWFNPASGAYVPIAGSPFANVGNREFTTSGDNGSGANDWLLILETWPRTP